jgi:hypothetical protein
MVDVFQAQRQLRQKLQPPRLRAGSVSSPEQPGQAHLPAATRARAAVRSNMRSRIVPPGVQGQRGTHLKPRSARRGQHATRQANQPRPGHRHRHRHRRRPLTGSSRPTRYRRTKAPSPTDSSLPSRTREPVVAVCQISLRLVACTSAFSRSWSRIRDTRKQGRYRSAHSLR